MGFIPITDPRCDARVRFIKIPLQGTVSIGMILHQFGMIIHIQRLTDNHLELHIILCIYPGGFAADLKPTFSIRHDKGIGILFRIIIIITEDRLPVYSDVM